LDDLAAITGKTRAQLINVLDGTATLTAAELELLLEFLHVAPDKKAQLLDLGSQARKRSGRRSGIDHIPISYRRTVGMEAIATQVHSYERGVIPDLLQTQEYALALMADGDGIWWEPSPIASYEHLAFWRTRHKLIMNTSPPKKLHFIIADDALRTEVGGPATMQRQREHILQLIDQRPTITIQVVPATISHNPVPRAGMTLLNMGTVDHVVALLSVLYGPPVYLDDPQDTTRLSRAFSRLRDIALGVDQSREFIDDLTTQQTGLVCETGAPHGYFGGVSTAAAGHNGW
jgi:hypothetical protein